MSSARAWYASHRGLDKKEAIERCAKDCGIDRKSARDAYRRCSVVERVCPPEVKVSGASGGFRLTGKNMYAERPTDTWKARFFALQHGMGYPLRLLSEQWGASEDTIRSRAKAHGALRYAEEKPGVYMAIAVHPDTPKGR